MLSVYNYLEFHTFIRDAWKAKKKKNPAYSISAWAKQLGLENPSPLSLAFHGKRPLPKKYLPFLIKSLNLSDAEARYLETLADLSSAKTPEQKLYYLSRLKDLSPKPEVGEFTVETYKLVSDPLHTTIIEMTDLKDFREDPHWIQEHLSFKADFEDVTSALDRLVKLGLLRIEHGKLKKTHKTLGTPPDLEELSTKKYHEAVCERTIEAIYSQAVQERELNSYSFNMKKEKVKAAKEKIRRFVDEFINEFEAKAGEGDHTHQFSIHLFKTSL